MDGLQMTVELLQEYLAACRAKGLSENTLSTYRARLTQFYALLPEDKTIRRGTIQTVAEQMRRTGYSVPASNLLLSAADGFVLWCDHPELQSAKRLEAEETVQPEITRAEYQRLLSAAKRADRERDYLLIKTIALTGVNLQELTALTLQDVERGWLTVNHGEMRRIPTALRGELKAFAGRIGATGTLFQTGKGTPLNRVAVTNAVKSLSKPARVDEEKCNPRCLRKLWQDTQAHFVEMMQTLVDQAQERLIETEQRATGWSDPPANAGSVFDLGLYDRQVMKD